MQPIELAKIIARTMLILTTILTQNHIPLTTFFLSRMHKQQLELFAR